MQLNLACPQSPVPTVEIDTEDKDDALLNATTALRRPLQAFARAKPKAVATLYVFSTPSVNFGRMTASIFIAIAGPAPLLTRVHSALQGAFRTRYSDYLPCAMATPLFHLEAATLHLRDESGVWRPIADLT